MTQDSLIFGKYGSGLVREIIRIGNDLYIGGSFTHKNVSGGPTIYSGLVKFDGTNFSNLGSRIHDDGNIEALHHADGYLYVGGEYDSVNGLGVGADNEIARWDLNSASWELIGDSFSSSSTVLDITSDESGTYFVGNAFLSNSNFHRWNDLACPKYNDLSHTDFSEATYQAREVLSSSGSVNESVTFLAGSAIVLKPDADCASDQFFSAVVAEGEAFVARIEGCSPSFLEAAPTFDEEARARTILSKGHYDLESAPSPVRFNCYPNPAHSGGIVKISFDLPQQEVVQLLIYDLNGQLVRTLSERKAFDAGQHGIDLLTTNLNSGIYVVLLKTATQQFQQRLIVVK